MSDPVSRLNADLEGLRVLLVASLLFLLLSCGDNDDPTGPTVYTLCNNQPDAAIATFEDANLEATVKHALGVRAQDDLTCGRASGLKTLEAQGAGIGRLMGIQNLTGLTDLALDSNQIHFISELSGLTSLTRLDLVANNITDISALSGLTGLTYLGLDGNGLIHLGPLSGLTSLAEQNQGHQRAERAHEPDAPRPPW